MRNLQFSDPLKMAIFDMLGLPTYRVRQWKRPH